MELASGVAAFEAKEFRRAFQLLAPLAARGEAEAQYRVAVMSQSGLGGVVNEALALSAMRDAAQQGHGLGPARSWRDVPLRGVRGERTRGRRPHGSGARPRRALRAR